MDNESTELFERIKRAADLHSENDDPDHAVGDLQDVLQAALEIMTADQRQELVARIEQDDLLVEWEDV